MIVRKWTQSPGTCPDSWIAFAGRLLRFYWSITCSFSHEWAWNWVSIEAMLTLSESISMGFKSHGDESIFVWESIEFEIPFSQSDGNLTFFFASLWSPQFSDWIRDDCISKVDQGKMNRTPLLVSLLNPLTEGYGEGFPWKNALKSSDYQAVAGTARNFNGVPFFKHSLG